MRVINIFKIVCIKRCLVANMAEYYAGKCWINPIEKLLGSYWYILIKVILLHGSIMVMRNALSASKHSPQ